MGQPGETTSAQRREYFRARIGLSLLIPTQPRARTHPREGVPYLPPTASGVDYRILRVRDLSGGGCCCETTDDWPQVGSHLTGYLYLGDTRGPLELDLLVLRRQEGGPAADFEVRLADARGPAEPAGNLADSQPEPLCTRDDEDATDETITLVAFRFLEMRESRRQRILRALFREFRRRRRQSSES